MPTPYAIAKGDTLSRIAQSNNTTLDEILKLNPTIKDPNKIYAGASLFLPDAMQTPAAPVVPSAPVAPPDPLKERARAAGAGGLSPGDAASIFGATPEEEKATKDNLAKSFGYEGFDAFAKEVFTKPSKTTEQFYRDAYSAAGLDKLLSDISSKKAALNQAIGAINDNPWLSEASRSGRARRLQELANADIENLQETYNLSLDQVKNLVAANSSDIGADEKRKDAMFNYLLKTAEDSTSKTGTARLASYLPDYLSGKQSTQEPKTVSVNEGQTVYQFNPATRSFELLASKPKTYPPKRAPKPTKPPTPQQDKTIAAFRSALSNRAALNRAGTREQFIRELQAKFPNIEPSDIARAVYETFPDGYDS